MRDRFSELIDAGVASFEYKPIAGNIPEQDPIARVYNNIFSIPTDTHMSYVDGHRYITGHMINTPKWDNFVCSGIVGNVDFTTTGYWSLCDFLNSNGLMMNKITLNGDIAVEVIEKPEEMPEFSSAVGPVKSFTTTESQIPQPIKLLVEDYNSIRFNKCFEGSKNLYEIANKLNEDVYIKGNNWLVYENKIIGKVNNDTCILTINESNGEYIRYIIKLTPGPSEKNWIKLDSFDNMFDRHNTVTVDKSNYKYSSANEFDIENMDTILKKVNADVIKTLKSLKFNQIYEIYGKEPYDEKLKIRPAKYTHSEL